MSLEAAIQENTAVMRELIARLTGVSTTAVEAPAAKAIDKVDGKSAPTAKTEAAAKAADTTTALDYEKDVRPVLVKVSTAKGREVLIKLLADHGATKGDQLKPDQYNTVVDAAKELLAA